MKQTEFDKEKYNSLLNVQHFVRYIIFGTASVLFGWIVLIFFVKFTKMNNHVVYYLSGHFGIGLSFILNYRFNFKITDRFWRRFLQKYMVALSGIFVGHFFVLFAISLFDNNLILTSFFSYFFVFIYQYILNKKFTYQL